MIGDGKIGDIKTITGMNKQTLTDDVTLALHVVTEKRTRTMTHMIDNATENDEFTRESVLQYGWENGDDFKVSMDDPGDIERFAEKFTDTLKLMCMKWK